MELLVSNDKEIYDITELVTSVTFTDKLNDGCSKLEFSFTEREPKIENANKVRFTYEDLVFSGFVFKHNHNNKHEINVTAYDQLRYAKAKDTIVVQGDTLTDLVKRMCNYFGLKAGYLADTNYILPTEAHEDKTWLDIIYGSIGDTLINKGTWYCLRDEAGQICLRNINDLKLDLVLGDESLAYNYDYQKSIDNNFYNQIKIYVKGKDENTVGYFISAKSEDSIKKYGLLQYFEIIENKNASQAKNKADILLKLYNREAETLSLSCLGDPRVRAGNSFYGKIEDIELEKTLIVRSVTHKFIPLHTMEIEVSL